jgi:hypothetical protein
MNAINKKIAFQLLILFVFVVIARPLSCDQGNPIRNVLDEIQKDCPSKNFVGYKALCKGYQKSAQCTKF